MAKITLGKRPKNFKRVVTVPMLEGGDGSIEVSYIYRTRSEFGAFLDELFSGAGITPASGTDDDVKATIASIFEKARDSNADYILKIVDGWNLDVEFSRAAVLQLCDELPGAALAMIEAYRLAIAEGRLGN